jgi:hypothetical protein
MQTFANAVGLMTCLASWLAAGQSFAQEAAPAAAPTQEQAPAEAPSVAAPASTTEAAPSAPSVAKAPAEEVATGTANAKQDDSAGEPGERKNEPRFQDANADHIVLFSTAETHPKGTFYFSDYELVFLQAGYAITDSVQVSLTGVPPLVKDQPYFFDLAVKGNFLRTEVLRLAMVGAGTVVVAPDADPNTVLGARLNGVSQFCFEALCKNSFSLNVGTFLNSESNRIVPITLAGGLVVQASSLVKLLLEPAYAIVIGEGVEDQPEGFLLNYGLRLSGEHFGFDLAFIRPFGPDIPLILGVPWVAFTYRTSGDKQ